MKRPLVYQAGGREQEIAPSDLPVSLGLGRHARLILPMDGDPIIVGHLNRDGNGHLFFEPSGAVDVIYARCEKPPPLPPPPPGLDEEEDDEDPPTVAERPEPTWDPHLLLSRTPLHDGDYLRFGEHCRVNVEIDGFTTRISAVRSRRSAFENVAKPVAPRRRKGVGLLGKLLVALFLVALLAAALGAWILMTSKRVTVATTPPADTLEVRGGWLPHLEIGGKLLKRQGTYRVHATLDGHHPLDTDLVVTNAPVQDFVLAMRPLPGRIHIDTDPSTTSPVNIGTNRLGNTPLNAVELEIGTYRVEVAPERYLPTNATLEVEGYGREQSLRLMLTPRWADITLRQPEGAAILVDAKPVGVSPHTFELFEGTYELRLRKPLYEEYTTELVVVANQPMTLPPIRLIPSPGIVHVSSDPPGAKVTREADGESTYLGVTPLRDIEVDAFKSHRFHIVKLGHGPVRHTVRLDPTEVTNVVVKLPELRGLVKMEVSPADAKLFINGEPRGLANRPLYLRAVPQEIEIRRDGYESFTRRLTPTPGFDQVVRASLVKIGPPGVGLPGTEPAPGAAGPPPNQYLEDNYALRRIEPGPFTLGSARGEQGRRSNETSRPVVLKRPFYMGVTEVTVGQFRKFESGYAPGSWSGEALGEADQPAVNLTWQQAAAYCNWLSAAARLPPAYVKRGDNLVPADPMTAGYRLPTEAEWEYCARFSAPGDVRLKYPWGGSMPPPKASGNYAGAEATDIIANSLQSFSDAFKVTGPVQSFGANALGLHDLGGNASEWCHDIYQIYSGTPEALTDPMGPTEGTLHVIRGSSWRDASISALRNGYRNYGEKPQPYVGFRVARYVQ